MEHTVTAAADISSDEDTVYVKEKVQKIMNNTREMEHLNRNYRGHVYHIFAGNQDDPEKIMHLLYLLARNEGDFKTIEEELKAILTNKMQDCDDNGKVVLTGLLYYIKKKIGE